MECTRIRKTMLFLTSHDQRNTKICIHRALQIKQKPVKCWKLPFFEDKLQVFVSYLSEMKIVCSITLPCSSTFYSLFIPYFGLEIFKFKYGKFFTRHSASISKFEWFEQPCHTNFNWVRSLKSLRQQGLKKIHLEKSAKHILPKMVDLWNEIFWWKSN